MTEIALIKSDITKLKVDAIVNAANSSLLGGGGVDGAIHKAAGKELLESCRLLGGCKTGEAKISKGFLLRASYVIHTVGPVYNYHSKEIAEQLLRDAYYNSLLWTEEYSIKSIAFPNISTGVYGFPKMEAASVAIRAVLDFIEEHSHLEKVVFCCFDEESFSIYKNLLDSKKQNM